MISVQKLPILEPEMRNALRQHILRKRQRLKQEIEQEAIEKRLKRERELRQVHDAMTLDQIKEQLNALERKMTNLREEKHNLFVQLKQVLSDDSSRKRPSRSDSSRKDNVTISESETTIAESNRVIAPKPSICSLASTHKPHISTNPITSAQHPAPARLAPAKLVAKPVQQSFQRNQIRPQEPLQMLNKQPSSKVNVQSQFKQPLSLIQQQQQKHPLYPIISHQQESSTRINSSLLTTVTSLARNDQVAHSGSNILPRKSLTQSFKADSILSLKGPLVASSSTELQANNPIDFTQPRVPANVVAHLKQSRIPFNTNVVQNLALSEQDTRFQSSTLKRPYNSIAPGEPILDARKRPTVNSHPSYSTNPSPLIFNGITHSMPGIPQMSQYGSIASHSNGLLNSHTSPSFAHETNFLQSNNFKLDQVRPKELNSSQNISHFSSFYPNVQVSNMNYRPNFPTGTEGQFAMPYSQMPQNFVNPVHQMNLSLPPAQNSYITSFNYPRKPFNPTYPYYHNK